MTLPIDGAIRGVAASGGSLFAAVERGKTTTIEAHRGSAIAWHVELATTGGPIAASSTRVAAAVGATDELGAGTVRGEPAAAIVGLELATGTKQWTLLLDSTEWVIATSLAPLGDDFIVGGSFGGTLRAGTHVVTSAGSSDGFVARVNAKGQIVWLIRLGGAGADGVQGVATTDQRIAIAGTFTTGAELAGVALPAYDDRLPFGDGFAAELDGNGARRWAQTFGGRADDAVAGVTIDGRGNVVVAASVHEVVGFGAAQHVTQGPSDGLLVWFRAGGEQGASVRVGGLDFDGLRAITSAGDKVIAGGFFSGSIKLGDRTLTAGGGDDSFIAAFDERGAVATAWHVGGDGREEITALAPIAGGFVAGVAHTAKAHVDDTKLDAPKDPMRGSALLVRGVP
ncbi:MAG TPA: hypothetical protein VIV40_14660 [Kofleriaceae bacterium]